MKEQQFEIEKENFETAVFFMLMNMEAQQRAMRQILLDHLSNITSNTTEEVRKFYEDTKSFYHQQVYDELFEKFASLRGLFGDKDEQK